MSTQPSVVVNKKGGVLTALVQGFFGFLIVSIVCVTLLGAYALWVADKKTDIALEWTEKIGNGGFTMVNSLAENLKDWREIAPPVLADALNDRRDPEYRDELEIEASVVPSDEGMGKGRILVQATNHGDETVSLLTARLVVSNADEIPITSVVTSIATPLAFQVEEQQFQGPLMPGATCRFIVTEPCHGRPLDVPLKSGVSYEVAELRIWQGPAAHAALDAPESAASRGSRQGTAISSATRPSH